MLGKTFTTNSKW